MIAPSLCRRAGAILTLACCSFGAAAANDFDSIRAAVLDLQVQTDLARERLLWSGQPLLDVYLANRVSGLEASAASLTVDGAEAAHAAFGPEQAAALAGGAWYRLLRNGSSAGTHQIHAELTVQGAQAPQSFSADAAIELGEGNTIAVVLDRGLVSAPQLRILALRARAHRPGLITQILNGLGVGLDESAYTRGSTSDPAMRYAQYLSATHENLAAAAELSALQRSVSEDNLDPHFDLALSQTLLDYDEIAAAEAALAAAQSPRSTAKEMIGLRFNLATQRYQHGAYAEALQVLSDKPQGSKDSPQRMAWLDLKARILLAQGQMSDAAALLNEIPPGADLLSYIRYYNYGCALVAEGNVAQGLTVLERVGAIYSTDAQLMALSDRANLVLGTHFLKAGQGATAIPLLDRVHTPGPYARRAALNLGWAWLAPAGTEQMPAAVGDERTVGPPPEAAQGIGSKWDQNLYQRFKLDPFSLAKVGNNEQERLQHALAVWSGVADQAGEDPSIAEAQLAIALKLQEVGARQGAAGYYARALAALETMSTSLDRAKGYIAGEQAQRELFEPDPQMGFDREPRALPPAPAAEHLSEVMAGWRFRTQLADFRDLRVLDGRVDQLVQALDGLLAGPCQAAASDAAASACAELRSRREAAIALKPQLGDATQAARLALQQTLFHELDAQQVWAKRLLRDARFELARVYDGAPAGP